MNRRAALATFASWGLGLAACHRSPETLRIGFIGGLSGTVAELGVQGRNGTLLAVETLNAQAGPRYELLVEDDQQNEEIGRRAIEHLADQHARFVVGPMTSSVAVAVAPTATRRNLALISPTATTDDLSGRADAFFRVAADASSGARQLADLLMHRGQRRAAVLMDERNRAYSRSFGNAFAARLRDSGGEVTAMTDYGTGQIDFAALAHALLATRPQTVLIVAGVGDSALAGQQLRRVDPHIGLAVTPWAANARFLQLGGHEVQGCLALQALNLDSPAPAYVNFRAQYRERFGEDPTTPAVQAYEAAMVGAQALRVAGERPLPQVLAGRRWAGLYSDIELDAHGDTKRPLHITEVREGRFASLPA